MKKSFVIFLFVAISLILTGCGTPKSSTGGSAELTAVSKMSATSDNAEVGSGSQTVTSELPPFDAGAIDSEYQKNYTQALSSVNTYFQNQAKFCAAVIEFPRDSIEFANQYFLFETANNQVKDWYGVVEIDPLLKVARRQLFAKKDYADVIKCATAATSSAPSFTAAYIAFLNDFPAVKDSSAKTQIALQDTNWRITAWDKDGAIIATQEVSLAGEAVSASPSATTGL